MKLNEWICKMNEKSFETFFNIYHLLSKVWNDLPGISVRLNTGLLNKHVLFTQAFAVSPKVSVLLSWLTVKCTSSRPLSPFINGPAPTTCSGNIETFRRAPEIQDKTLQYNFRLPLILSNWTKIWEPNSYISLMFINSYFIFFANHRKLLRLLPYIEGNHKLNFRDNFFHVVICISWVSSSYTDSKIYLWSR